MQSSERAKTRELLLLRLTEVDSHKGRVTDVGVKTKAVADWEHRIAALCGSDRAEYARRVSAKHIEMLELMVMSPDASSIRAPLKRCKDVAKTWDAICGGGADQLMPMFRSMLNAIKSMNTLAALSVIDQFEQNLADKKHQIVAYFLN